MIQILNWKPQKIEKKKILIKSDIENDPKSKELQK